MYIHVDWYKGISTVYRYTCNTRKNKLRKDVSARQKDVMFSAFELYHLCYNMINISAPHRLIRGGNVNDLTPAR